MDSLVRRATVITVSDRVAAGARADISGAVGVELLTAAGWQAEVIVAPDEQAQISAAIRAAADAGIRLVVTTGGTGIGPRDVTPEATALLLERQLPGVAEQIRRVGIGKLPAAMLSRGLAGICAQTFVVNLAGSTGAVRDGMPVVLDVADHVVTQLAGGDHP